MIIINLHALTLKYDPIWVKGQIKEIHVVEEIYRKEYTVCRILDYAISVLAIFCFLIKSSCSRCQMEGMLVFSKNVLSWVSVLHALSSAHDTKEKPQFPCQSCF